LPLKMQGHTVVQLIDALHYNAEGYGFDSWLLRYDPGIDLGFNRNENQRDLRGEGVRTAGA
jgi:hypothetical protein